MKNLFIILAILFFISAPLISENTEHFKTEDIETAIKNGNTQQLALHFNSSIKLDLLGQSKIYSSRQAELILNHFFLQNKPLNYTVKNTRKNNGAEKITGQLETKHSTFRVVYTVFEENRSKYINSFRLDKM